MSDKSGQTTLEVIAPSVEEAIENGLAQLNLPQDAVDIEILDRGNKGLFGLGQRQARVRLIVQGNQPAKPVPTMQQQDEQLQARDESEVSEDENLEAEEIIDDFNDLDDEVFAPKPGISNEDLSDDEQQMMRVAQATVSDLLERMKVEAEVTATYLPPEDEGQRPTIWVDITGNDLSILIGRRSQTLQALQYITSIIVGKELGKAVPLTVDVEGYRSRRQNQLRRIAQTMAEQAVKTGRRQALEPMPANERRIIHLELRNYPGVKTESIGEEPHRKVTIIPMSE
jgi:spoIIIJ-associated protein